SESLATERSAASPSPRSTFGRSPRLRSRAPLTRHCARSSATSRRAIRRWCSTRSRLLASGSHFPRAHRRPLSPLPSSSQTTSWRILEMGPRPPCPGGNPCRSPSSHRPLPCREPIQTVQPTISETPAMKLVHAPYAASAVLLLALVGCKIRNPVGGCPYNEVEVPPQFVTPWDTVLEDDVEDLTGPFPGTLTWLDGDDVITVPKAGQAIEVEAEVEVDLATARMHEFIMGDRVAACE